VADLTVDTQLDGSDTGSSDLGGTSFDSVSALSFGAGFDAVSHFDIRNIKVGTTGFGSSDLFAPALDDLSEFDGLFGDDGSLVASGGVLSVDNDTGGLHYGWKDIGAETDFYVQFDLRIRDGDEDPDYFDAWNTDADAEAGSGNTLGLFQTGVGGVYVFYSSDAGAIDFGPVPANGTWATIGLHITYGPGELTADFTFTLDSPYGPTTAHFTDTSTPGPSGPITGWAWDFGDGGTSTDENPDHVYEPGTYEVKLTVTGTSPDGTASYTLPELDIPAAAPTASFIVQNSGPTQVQPSPPSFTITNEGVVPFIAYFRDTSLEGESPITSWAWDFGDGNTSTDQYPLNVYTDVGSYTVTLTVTNDEGESTAMQTVTVVGKPSVESLGLLYHELIAGSSVDVTGISLPASSYLGGATVLVAFLLPSGTDMVEKWIDEGDGVHGINMTDVTASDDTTPGFYGDRIWSDGANQYWVGLNEIGSDDYHTDDSWTETYRWRGSLVLGLVMNEITPGDTVTIEFGDTYAGMSVIVVGYTGVQFDNKHNWAAEYEYGLGSGSLDAGGFSWADGDMFVDGNTHNSRGGPSPISPFGAWQNYDADDDEEPGVDSGFWSALMTSGGEMLGNQIDDPDGTGPGEIAYVYFPHTLNDNNDMASPISRPVCVLADYMLYMAFLPMQYGQTEETTYLLFPPSPTIKWVGIEPGSLAVDETGLTTLLAADDLSEDADLSGDPDASGQSILLGDKPLDPVIYPDAYGLTMGDGTLNYDNYNLGGTFVTAEGNPVIPDMQPGPWQVANSIAVFGLAFTAGLGPWFGGGLHIWQRF
jgi:PKD repeat protein